MEKYKNLGGNSGVISYESNDKSITIKFSNGRKYSYTYEEYGEKVIEKMKRLAVEGQGLNTYINQHVKNDRNSRVVSNKRQPRIFG